MLKTRLQGSRKALFWSPKTRPEMKISFWNVCGASSGKPYGAHAGYRCQHRELANR